VTTPAAYAAAKGDLGITSTPVVRWRLPTIYDYKQADIDGIRAVLPGMDADIREWTATVSATYRDSAWYFKAPQGSINSTFRNTLQGARCVGR
jgi:hypothetical protein